MPEDTIALEEAPTEAPAETPTEAAPSTEVHEVMTESFHGGKFYDAETKSLDTSKLGDAYTGLLQNNLKRTEDLRGELQAEALKNRPEEVSGYDFKPEDDLMPEGVEHVWKDDDPTLAWFKAQSHRRGLSNDEFNADVNMYVRDQWKRHNDNALAQSKGQMAKLGERGVARVDAVESWAKSTLSDDSADALVGGLRDTLGNLHVSSAIIEALEEIIGLGKSDMSLPKDSIPASVTRDQYEADTEALMNTPEFIRGDKGIQAKVANRFKALFPGGQKRSVSAGFRR